MAAKLTNWLKDVLDAISGDERFIITLGAGVVNTILRWQDIISEVVYRDLILGTVGVFIAGSAYTAGVHIRQQAQIELARITEEPGVIPPEGR